LHFPGFEHSDPPAPYTFVLHRLLETASESASDACKARLQDLLKRKQLLGFSAKDSRPQALSMNRALTGGFFSVSGVLLLSLS
jgi:hypothetical protein